MGSQRTYLEGRGELGNSSLLLMGKHLSEPSPGGAKGPQVSGRLLGHSRFGVLLTSLASPRGTESGVVRGGGGRQQLDSFLRTQHSQVT